MPTTMTLTHCEAVVVPVPGLPASGQLDLGVGGAPGDGYVAFTASDQNGTQLVNVPTGSPMPTSLPVDGLSLVTAHYYATGPKAPTTVDIEVELK